MATDSTDPIEKHLTQGESIVLRAKLSKLVVFTPIFFGVLLGLSGLPTLFVEDTRIVGLILMGFGGLLIAYAMLVLKSSYFLVTNKRIMMKRGVFSTKSFEMLLTKVESITYSQGILEKMNGIGTMIITGSGGTKEIISGILEPKKFKDVAQQEIENHHQSSMGGRASTGSSSADELTKLADLYTKGILTKEEFDAQKKKLLAV